MSISPSSTLRRPIQHMPVPTYYVLARSSLARGVRFAIRSQHGPCHTTKSIIGNCAFSSCCTLVRTFLLLFPSKDHLDCPRFAATNTPTACLIFAAAVGSCLFYPRDSGAGGESPDRPPRAPLQAGTARAEHSGGSGFRAGSAVSGLLHYAADYTAHSSTEKFRCGEHSSPKSELVWLQLVCLV